MKMLIAYASIEGQTRKIAQTLGAHIEERGWQVALLNVVQMGDFAMERPDAAILCAPIHAGRYPTPFIHFVRNQQTWLNSHPSALVSVTLSVHSEIAAEVVEAKAFPDALMAETGWQPKAIHHAAGALRFTEYDFFKRWMLKRISRHEGGPVDTSRDFEFTDWAALNTFADAFLPLASSG